MDISTQVLYQPYVLGEPQMDPSNRIGSMNMGYVSDTARIRTHNLFRPKCVPIPLGHSDGFLHCSICCVRWSTEFGFGEWGTLGVGG